MLEGCSYTAERDGVVAHAMCLSVLLLCMVASSMELPRICFVASVQHLIFLFIHVLQLVPFAIVIARKRLPITASVMLLSQIEQNVLIIFVL